MPSLSHVCVFCGASSGNDPAFARDADALGRALARRGMTLVFGGGSVGLMGAVADGAIAAGGRTIGVITELLHDKELGHRGLTRLHVVKTMHERKMAMAQHADAFVVLPGGFGTLDEMFEIIAWAQLGIHAKPVGLVNTSGFFDGLLVFLDHAGASGFLRLSHRQHVFAEGEPERLLDRLVGGPPADIARGGLFPEDQRCRAAGASKSSPP